MLPPPCSPTLGGRVRQTVSRPGETRMGTSFEVDAGGGAGGGMAVIGTVLGRDVRPRSETTAPIQRIADDDRGTGGESLADFLGYFSIGLGMAEAIMPGVIARVIGIKHPDDRSRTTVRLMGLRE